MVDEKFRMRVAVYLILKKDNKILLQRRFNTGWMDGYYSLIAGHVEENETISTAMVREALEEANVTVAKKDLKPATVIHKKSNDEYIDFFYVTQKWTGEPKINETNKCDDLRWFEIDDLPDNLLPFIKEAIEKYQNNVPFFESGWNS